MTTITLSNIPDLTASVSPPRVAAIEYPLGRTLGQPRDAQGQMAVLRATLKVLAELEIPGGVVNLDFEWPESPKEARSHPPEPPPIAAYLQRHIWQLPRLLSRNPPEKS